MSPADLVDPGVVPWPRATVTPIPMQACSLTCQRPPAPKYVVDLATVAEDILAPVRLPRTVGRGTVICSGISGLAGLASVPWPTTRISPIVFDSC
jgi:hypothetical protein